jgi:thiamine biosynthesis lipoprotein
MLDPNALAQGQSVDVICDFLLSKGIKNYLVDIGGEVKVKGKKYKNLWLVAVDKPIDGNMEEGKDIQVKLFITDIALATSGDYRKFYVEDGKKYSHSINPKTGLPARQNILSVTIFAQSCITADAIATACMVSGFEKSLQILKENPELEAYFIYVDNHGKTKVFYTKGVEKYLK